MFPVGRALFGSALFVVYLINNSSLGSMGTGFQMVQATIWLSRLSATLGVGFAVVGIHMTYSREKMFYTSITLWFLASLGLLSILFG